MYQRKMQEKITKADQHDHIDQLKDQSAYTNTQENIHPADGCCVKAFEDQLLPELKKYE